MEPHLEKLAELVEVEYKHLATDREAFTDAVVKSTPTLILVDEQGEEVNRLINPPNYMSIKTQFKL